MYFFWMINSYLTYLFVKGTILFVIDNYRYVCHVFFYEYYVWSYSNVGKWTVEFVLSVVVLCVSICIPCGMFLSAKSWVVALRRCRGCLWLGRAGHIFCLPPPRHPSMPLLSYHILDLWQTHSYTGIIRK